MKRALTIASAVFDVVAYLAAIALDVAAVGNQNWSEATFWLLLAIFNYVGNYVRDQRKSQRTVVNVTLDGTAMERAILKSRRERGL